jgi:hypothetical protein
MYTLEEQERKAFADGNYDLAHVLARVIDLEDDACELRAAAMAQLEALCERIGSEKFNATIKQVQS